MFRFLTFFLLTFLIFQEGHCCSRIFYNKAPGKMVVSRSLDWHEPMGDVLKVYPRGQKSKGLSEINAAEWTARYGSILLEGKHYHNGGIEGVNEKGLAAHVLYLEETDYGPRDERPGVSYLVWVRYLLGNFASVEEALEGMKKIQIVPTEIKGKIMPLHLALEDATGDSAIVEILNGSYEVYHSKEHAVLTNEPAYHLQLLNLKQYEPFGGKEPIPPKDRFARAHYHLQSVSEPQYDCSVLGFDLISKVSVDQTWWTSVTDLSQKKFYYRSSKTQKIVWVDLKEIDFSKCLALDLENDELVGDISNCFSL